MTTVEKMKAMKAAFDVSIGLNIYDRWYASGPEQGGDGLLRGIMGVGTTPEEAIDNLWSEVCLVKSPLHIRISDTKRVRWNGYMWEDAGEVVTR